MRDSRRFRYAGPCFAAASALPLGAGLGHPARLAVLAACVVRRPWQIAALIVLLLQTPREHVFLSESFAGQALRDHFNQRFCGIFPQNRLLRGVLLLPQDHSEYLRGRRRQALRTNLRKAAAAGMRCEGTADAACAPAAPGAPAAPATGALEAAEQIVRDRRTTMTAAELTELKRAWRAPFARPEMTLLIARDPSGRPLALTAAVIDEAVCLVHVAVASSHEARWALHDHLVQLLIARGVRYLLVEGAGPFGALGFEPEVHHYQRLLGYELRHLVPRAPARRPRTGTRRPHAP
jgi:hypothetical protein